MWSEANYQRAVDTTAGDADCGGSFRLWIGTGGDVVLVDSHGNEITRTNVPSGSYIFGEWQTVRQTGTTASDIVADLRVV